LSGDEINLEEAWMKQEVTESDVVDLYEQMLYERATKGIRPALYVSSSIDLECSALLLLNRPAEVLLAGRAARNKNPL
jgi:hypothetical protein